jgi:uncharacterized membrane protein
MFSSLFTVFTFLLGHLELVIGYVIAVVFPMPVVSQFILNIWGKLWTQFKSLFPAAAADVTNVVNDVNAAVTTADTSL